MQLTPHYGTDPLIELDGDPAAVLVPLARQRARLAQLLAELDEVAWATPSRCEGWSVRDVIVHLDSTNAFWSFSIDAGRRGEPTRFLATFDPVASPAELVARSDQPPSEVLDRFTASTAVLADQLGALEPDEWRLLAEAPPGHLSISAVAHHALWDAWVHERDIALPLDITPPTEADEAIACLRYVAALAPAFARSSGIADRGTLAIEATDPEVAVSVTVGDQVTVTTGATGAEADLRLTGDAVELVEVLSVRAPLPGDLDPRASWLVGGLRTIFDQPS
jgi:uncharacterized protein (TIGR03083 family)